MGHLQPCQVIWGDSYFLLAGVNAQAQYGDYGLTGQGDYGRGFGDNGYVPLQQEAADPCGLDPTGCYLETGCHNLPSQVPRLT